MVEVIFQKASPLTFIASHYRFSSAPPESLLDHTSCKWNESKKFYECPLSQRLSIKEKLEKEGYTVSDIPGWILNSFSETNSQQKEQSTSSCLNLQELSSLFLYEYQKKALLQILEQKGIGLLADESSLGKSTTAIGAMLNYRHNWPLLIVVPSWKKEQWKANIIRAGICSRKITLIEKQNVELDRDIEALIISYDMCSKYTSVLQRFQIGIADQAEELKYFTSQKAQTLIPIFQKMKQKLLITSELSSLKPKYILNFLKIMAPAVFRYPNLFLERYCDPSPSQYVPDKIDYEGISNEIELQYILSHFLIIRTRFEVKQELPHFIRKRIYFQGEKSKTSKLSFMMREIKTLDIMSQVQQIDLIQKSSNTDNDLQQETQRNAINKDLQHLEILNMAAKQKGIRKFFKDYEFKKIGVAAASALLIVVKTETAKEAVIAGLDDIEQPFKVIRNADNIDQRQQKGMCFIIDYKTIMEITQSIGFINVSTIIFAELDCIRYSIQCIERMAINLTDNLVQCLYLFTIGGSLDEMLFDIFFSTNFRIPSQSPKPAIPSIRIQRNNINRGRFEENTNEFQITDTRQEIQEIERISNAAIDLIDQARLKRRNYHTLLETEKKMKINIGNTNEFVHTNNNSVQLLSTPSLKERKNDEQQNWLTEIKEKNPNPQLSPPKQLRTSEIHNKGIDSYIFTQIDKMYQIDF